MRREPNGYVGCMWSVCGVFGTLGRWISEWMVFSQNVWGYFGHLEKTYAKLLFLEKKIILPNQLEMLQTLVSLNIFHQHQLWGFWWHCGDDGFNFGEKNRILLVGRWNTEARYGLAGAEGLRKDPVHELCRPAPNSISWKAGLLQIWTYCWWLKSCTTWDVWNLINNGKNYQPQLVQDFSHQQ